MRRRLHRRYGRARVFGPQTLSDFARSREGTKRYQVERHPLDRQGYDRRGRYYGSGEALWDVWDSQDDVYYEVRASDARRAREKVISDPSKWRYRR